MTACLNLKSSSGQLHVFTRWLHPANCTIPACKVGSLLAGLLLHRLIDPAPGKLLERCLLKIT